MRKIILMLMLVMISIVSASYTEDTTHSFTGLMHASQAWADYDHDTYLDVVVCGQTSSNDPMTAKTFLYDYDGSSFTQSTPFESVSRCSVNFGDLDNDGWVDLVLSGYNGTDEILNIYKNTNGAFSLYQALDGTARGNTVLGDLDNDNDLDLIAFGCNETIDDDECHGNRTQVYINTNGVLTVSDSWSTLINVSLGSMALADYDNNGYLDLAIAGGQGNKTFDNSYALTKLYKNTGSSFVEDTDNNIEGIFWGSMAWFDYDNDGDVDLFAAGENNNSQVITKVFNNDNSLYGINTQPSAPSILQNTTSDSSNNILYTLNWSKGNDMETGQDGLYYNLRLLNSTGGIIFSGEYPRSSNPTQGYFGNMMQSRNYSFVGPKQCIRWQVQTVDPGLKFSEWSDVGEISFAEIPDDNLDQDCNGIDQTTPKEEGGNGNKEQTGASEISTPNPPGDDGIPGISDLIPELPQIEQPLANNGDIKDIEQTILDQALNNFLQIQRNYVVSGGKTQITEKVKNVDIFDRNLNLSVNIPKEIAENADEINPITEFNVIEFDPVIGFSSNIKSFDEENFQYSFDKELSVDEIVSIVSSLIEDEEETKKFQEEFKRKLEETEKAINVSQTFQVKDNKTTFTIDIDIDKTKQLTNVSIFQEIPKCLVEIINDQMIEAENKEFEIINADPLIVWHFDNLLDAKQIQYTIDAVGDENCTNQVQALAVAKDIILVKKASDINYYNLWIALSIIPIIAIIMIIFGMLTTKIEHDDEEIRKLTDYIRNHYRHGLKKYEIKEKLIKEGYAPHIIDECLHLHTQSKFHYWIHRLEISFDELVLATLIILNILDFTETLPGDADYLKKIISWVLLAYLLFRTSITEVLLGKKFKLLDTALIFTFFTFTFKNIIAYAKVAFQEVDFVLDLYAYLVNNNIIFERYVFLGGIIALAIISLYIAIRIPIKSPSFLSAMHVKEEMPDGPIKIVQRFIIVHLTLLVFFVLIFNLMMEWLAIAVDALILVITLVIMVFIIIKHHKKLTAGKFMEETSEAAEKFYEKFINLFHYKKTIYLGISGMLILHALTEVGNFIIPYFIGVHDAIYFGNFDAGHTPLFAWAGESLYALQTAGLGLDIGIAVAYAYMMNIIALMLLFMLPAFVWYNYFKHRELPIIDVARFRITANHAINSLLFGLFCSSMVMFFSKPVFMLQSLLGAENLAGVDILTQQISLAFLNETVWISLGIFAITFLLAFRFEKIMNYIMLPISYGFFAYYIFLFARSITLYNITQFNILIRSEIAIAMYTLMFGLIAVLLLYSGGFIINSYIYAPHWMKALMQKVPVLKLFFHKHDYHHIHYHEHHDDTKHDSKVKVIEQYILKSLDAGHELFYIVEHIREHNWPNEIIEEAMDMAKHEKLFKEDIKHVKHYHHNKEKIHQLAEWISKVYGTHSMKDILDTCVKNRWTEDDIIIAFKQLSHKVKIKDEDREIMRYMFVLH
ncbi:VCBS repeat-containing protein [Candidatus Woesearchaeota archaeon]|nr:VCBS repeat-containing protein [Candidatus Woesearchaeota archaeon]